MNMTWLQAPTAPWNDTARREAEARQTRLTKPPGALGQLESLAIRLAAMQATSKPSANAVHICIFAADHGVAAEGVSAFPQAVTTEMVRNFARGGAAICVLARHIEASLEVVNLGTIVDTVGLDGVLNLRLGAGTENFVNGPAMSGEQLAHALGAGRDAVERALAARAQLFIGGEMGIANTTAATALACGLLNKQPGELVGPGTGLDRDGVAHKALIVARALELHHTNLADPLQALRRLGGFEIAALCGAYIACAQRGLPALVDGFITSVAALAAVRLSPGVNDWLLHTHGSAEPGHAVILEAMQAQPLFSLGMRLGEASGAATAVPLLRLACALHNGMATFAEAGVSEKI